MDKRSQQILLIAMLAAAFYLRIAFIDQQSIWYDEGLSIYYARGTVGEILHEVAASDHPPLHPLVLHIWIALCGDSELSVRLLSAWWGVAAVALTYRLAKRVSRSIGALAALLMTISPFAVWYSQEVRGYTMTLALVTGAADTALGLLATRTKSSWWRYALYVLLAAAAMYTHFYSGFVLLALNLGYIVLDIRSIVYTRPGRARLARWAISQIAVLAVFGPWIPFVISQMRLNATYWHGSVDWQQIVSSTLSAFSVGTTLTNGWAAAGTWAMASLAMLGTLSLGWLRQKREYMILAWIWMLVPSVFLIAISHTRPKFSPRYLMNALPPFLLLVSAGGRHLFEITRRHAFTWRGWASAVTLLLTAGVIGGATTRSLANLYFDQRVFRPDFRAVVHYIEDHASPTDLIVLVGGHSYPAFIYYYHGDLPVLPLPSSLLPTTQRPIGLDALETLDKAIQGRQHLWLVLWQEALADPMGLIVDEIEQTYHRLGVGESFHQVALLAFDVSPGPLLSRNVAPQVPMSADFGHEVRLLGYDLPVDTAHPGDTLYLYLYWEALPEVAHDYKVFTQILGSSGQIVAQHDKMAGAASYPTSHWIPGDMVRDRFLLTIRPDAEPGRYQLIAGLYKPSSQLRRLPVEGDGARGDHILLAEIQLTGR